MWLLTALGAIVLMLKTGVTYVAVALTALVAVGNELSRWKIVFRYLEGRQIVLRRAWGSSLLLYFALACLYAYIERRTDTLVVDCLGIVVMVGTVVFLAWRHNAKESKAREPLEPEEPVTRRNGAVREPRRPRREPTAAATVAAPEPDEPDEDDDLNPRPYRRRRRRVPRE